MFRFANRLHFQTALLTLRKDQYFHHLDSNLKENEKETSSKLLLYSYDPDKYRQLQMDFQAQTMLTEHLKKKACVSVENDEPITLI